MKHCIEKYLSDILLSMELVAQHINSVENLEQYLQNDLVKDAVTRRLSIIGEALFQADKQYKNLAISNKERIIGLRHILVHDYDVVNDELIWSIVHTHLPRLMEETKAILEN